MPVTQSTSQMKKIARRWCWTIWDLSLATVISISKLTNADGVESLVVDRERDSQGKLHLQGYLTLSKKKRGSQVKSLLHPQAHLEVSQGTSDQAWTYCLKDHDVVIIYGVPPLSSTRASDRDVFLKKTSKVSPTEERLLDLKRKLDTGATVEQLWDSDFYTMCRYGQAIEKYLLVKRPARQPPVVTVLVGPTGVGKTRFVWDQASIFDLRVWVYPGKGWFDGYTGQELALFEEFRGDLDIGLFLQCLDRYPLRVPVKGGFTNWNPRYIYVTSNVRWDHWYKDLDVASLAALSRRLTYNHVVHEPIY